MNRRRAPSRFSSNSVRSVLVRGPFAYSVVSAALCAAVVSLIAVIDGAGQDCPAYLPGAQVGVVADNALIEISGLAASRQNPGVLWVHNDSGDSARVFAINMQGTLLGVYNLGGALATDYEDIAIGPGPVPGQDYLYIGDTGDNNKIRQSITVYRVAEPPVAPDQSPVEEDLVGVDALPMVYPGTIFDSETLLVDPITTNIYLVTRDRGNVNGGVSFVFCNPFPQVADDIVTLEPITSISAPDQIKGGDISPAGDRILLRPAVANQPVDALLWIWENGMGIADVFAQTPCGVPAAAEPQGEAIAFSDDGTSYYTISEGQQQPIYVYGPQTPETLNYAQSESSVDGTVSGSLLDTFVSDDIYEEIQEMTRGGNPSKRRSLLEHKWTLQLPPGDQVTIFVEAHHTPNTEGDDFIFAYSTDDNTYTEILTVTKTTDDDTVQSLDLPNTLSGTVCIRVRDTDRTRGHGAADSLFVDQLYVRVIAGSPVLSDPAFNPSPANGALEVSISTDLVWDAGSGASSHSVYFGPVNPPPLIGSQTATSFDPGTLLPNTTYYWRIDEVNSAGATVGDVWNFMTGDAPAVVNDVADGESLTTGTQTGSFLATHVSDDFYEELTEARIGRSSKNQKSALEHAWTIQATGGSLVTFFVEAHHTANTEGDDFFFYYSLDNVNFTEMLTVEKTSDDDTLQSFELPATTAGTVHILVLDADNSRGNKSQDSLFIDEMFIQSQ